MPRNEPTLNTEGSARHFKPLQGVHMFKHPVCRRRLTFNSLLAFVAHSGAGTDLVEEAHTAP
jgi:hypothetical protein